jgi:catechol 2,3-dioxygenase-like lactoylglutathione lyase family enzyme
MGYQELLQALAPLQAWAQQWSEQLREQEETEHAQTDLERSRRPMSSSQSSHPTFLGIAPRFVVRDLEQALAFYEQLGFQTTYHDEDFAIVERDKVSLHLNYFQDFPTGKHAVCWIASTDIDALYQQYLPAEARQAPLQTKPWGFKEFTMRDPSGNLIIFAEHIPEADASTEQGA